MSQDFVTLLFKNTSGAKCVINGYPGVALFDASGHKLGDAARTPSGFFGGLSSDSVHPPILELRPDETASADVEGAYQGSNPTPCPPVAAMEVTPPGETHSVRLTAGMYGCSPRVTPIVPGNTGSAR